MPARIVKTQSADETGQDARRISYTRSSTRSAPSRFATVAHSSERRRIDLVRDTLLHPSLDPADWHRMSEYLDKAFELEPPERERWLMDLATTEPNVADTLRRLLARQESLAADGFLETSPLLVLSDLANSGRTAQAGERIGAYTLERPLGRGGMGEVWLASRSDGRFEARCAIKFLDSLAGPGR